MAEFIQLRKYSDKVIVNIKYFHSILDLLSHDFTQFDGISNDIKMYLFFFVMGSRASFQYVSCITTISATIDRISAFKLHIFQLIFIRNHSYPIKFIQEITFSYRHAFQMTWIIPLFILQ